MRYLTTALAIVTLSTVGCGPQLGPAIINNSADVIMCTPFNDFKRYNPIEVAPGDEVAVPEGTPRANKQTRTDNASCILKSDPLKKPDYKHILSRHPDGSTQGAALSAITDLATGKVSSVYADLWFRWPLE